MITEPEIIAVDEQQKLIKVNDRTLHLQWNKYTNCWEAEVFVQIQDKYGRFVNEYFTSVTGVSEQECLKNAIEINIENT
tara:strand:- start:732 stop:968 length:237 start_codon:yes stop_codon:yes gene_type:complete